MKYNAKILLFGEHTVVKGSQALAIPMPSYFGTWQFAVDSEEKQTLQQTLPQLFQYLNEIGFDKVLDLPTFWKELDQGVFFQSSIPTGYGLGSSGALCAAIFDRYKLLQVNSLTILKTFLGQMESFFHGASSGIDPLVCYLNYPLLIGADGHIQKAEMVRETPFEKGVIFLLDTHIQRKTAPYVNGFLERCKEEYYNQSCQSILVPAVNNAIAAFLAGNWEVLYSNWTSISQFQATYFDFMIPEAFKSIWNIGLNSTHFKLKICGAGGGGFLLGISNDFEKTKLALKHYDLLVMNDKL